MVIPRNLAARQSELLEELRGSLTAENLEELADESLLSKVKRALPLIRLAVPRIRRARGDRARGAARAGAGGVRGGRRRRRTSSSRSTARRGAARPPAGDARSAAPCRGRAYRGPRRLGRPLARIPQAGQIGHVHVRPPWSSRRRRPRGSTWSIDPGQAFGTGAHPTTRLCSSCCSRSSPPAAGSCADLGCGSGVLAIAARSSASARSRPSTTNRRRSRPPPRTPASTASRAERVERRPSRAGRRPWHR